MLRKSPCPLADRKCLAQRGFSLVETLVIIGILGLVVAIGVPGLISQLSKVRLEATANEVANLVRQTRMRAIRDNTTYTVEVSGIIVEGQTLVGSTAGSPFELEFNDPPIEIYNNTSIADCQDKYDGSGTFWGGTSITYDSTGTAGDTGAICVWDGDDNILQIVVEFPAGPPTVRKFLKAADAPGARGFYEKASAATSSAAWTWY